MKRGPQPWPAELDGRHTAATVGGCLQVASEPHVRALTDPQAAAAAAQNPGRHLVSLVNFQGST